MNKIQFCQGKYDQYSKSNTNRGHSTYTIKYIGFCVRKERVEPENVKMYNI